MQDLTVPEAGGVDITALDAVLRNLEGRCRAASRHHAEANGLWYALSPRARRHVLEECNEAIHEPVTVFHSGVVPPVSLVELNVAMMRPETGMTTTTAAIAVALFRRYEVATGLAVTTLMMHRLFITALLVATKTHQDAVCGNYVVALASGIPCAELNRLEAALLIALDWRSLVTDDDLAALVAPLCTTTSSAAESALPQLMKRVPSWGTVTTSESGASIIMTPRPLSTDELPTSPVGSDDPASLPPRCEGHAQIALALPAAPAGRLPL